ncbi:MAG TPA: radical SAM protein [Longimicrobium sp.]|nr:radical SAM protein [Longimicrobium sp.]
MNPVHLPTSHFSRGVPYGERREIGPWFQAGRQLGGAEVQERLARQAASVRGAGRAYCVYVHVPFCQRLCSFCALYTRAVPRQSGPVLDEFLALTVLATERHPGAFPPHPPTTVHFGGGTPLVLGPPRFRVLTEALRAVFGDTPGCEWAVETTTSSVDEASLQALRELGFSRIHLGIQSLDDGVRRAAGRRESGAQALAKVERALAAGFNVSVDLIIGFAGAGARTIPRDAARLFAAGVRMFSVCELRHLRSVPPAGEKAGGGRGRNYASWCLLWERMKRRGLRPIHLGQFGRSDRDNLYFTHPARGEDCVAIGPYAHGSARNLVYANALTPDYYAALRARRSPVTFGVALEGAPRRIRDLERELVAHRVTPRSVERVCEGYGEPAQRLVGRWVGDGLLVPGGEPGNLEPSREGSWFLGNMVGELRGLEPSRAKAAPFTPAGEAA